MAQDIIERYYTSKSELFCFHRNSMTGSTADDEFSISHTHRHYEIFQLLGGEIVCTVSGRQYRLKSGDMVIINMNEFHSINRLTDIYSRRVIEFEGEFLQNSLLNLDSALRVFSAPKERFDSYISSDTVKKFRLDRIWDSLEQSIDDQIDTDSFMVVHTFELILTIKKIWQTVEPTLPHKFNPLVGDALTYINSNIEMELTLGDIAKNISVSKHHLSRVFSKDVGRSIMNYVMFKKILHAESLIASGLPPTEACAAVSINDYSNFYKNYVKIVQKTPKQTQRCRVWEKK